MLQAVEARLIPFPQLDARVARAADRVVDPVVGRDATGPAEGKAGILRGAPPTEVLPDAPVFPRDAISETARRALVVSQARPGAGAAEAVSREAEIAAAASEDETGPDGLTEAERDVVDKLAARDREVRDHEEAHARVGGQYAGQPSYTYQLGPDGARYAIGGSVPIDVSPVKDDPEATIAKMAVVKAAALAPAEPSSTDRRIAALADAQSRAASAALAAERVERLAEASEATARDGGADDTPEQAAAIGLPAALAALAPDGAGGQLSTRV
ncbi:MAG: putative metalloprotease CJM1_0395 family protein [Pseudomonadota bacterium]